ncbi:MAG: carboxypeptidase-like regulatory domain-containing protein [Candidatus Nanohaloarchaea archaeon]
MRKLLSILVLIAITPTLVAGLTIPADEFTVAPENPVAGKDSVTVRFTAESSGFNNKVQYVKAKWSDSTDWNQKYCGEQICDRTEYRWTFTPQSAGQKTIEVQATSSDPAENPVTQSKTITVQSQKEVSITNPRPSDGATINDRSPDLSVRYEGDGFGSLTFRDSAGNFIGRCGTASGTRCGTTWFGLERGKTYNWKVKASDGMNSKTRSFSFTVQEESQQQQETKITDYGFEGTEPLDQRVHLFVEINRNPDGVESCKFRRSSSISGTTGNLMQRDSSTALRWDKFESFSSGTQTVAFQCYDSNNNPITEKKIVTFRVGETSTGNRRPTVTLLEPNDGTRVSTSPRFEFRGRDSDGDRLDYVLYVDSDSTPFQGWEHRQEYYNRRAGDTVSTSPFFLRDNEDYSWGVKVDDDVNSRESSVRDFTTRDSSDRDRDGSLRVTARDGSGDRLRNARVIVRNGDSRSRFTGSDGEAFFSSLEPDRYDVEVRCQGREVNRDVRVSSGESESITVRFAQSFSSNDCDTDRGGGRPDARLSVRPDPSNTGEQVTFDARDSRPNGGSIEEYWFDINGDGVYEIKNDFDGVVRKTFSSTRSRTARVKVFDSEDLSDTASRFYTVRSGRESCDVDIGTLGVYPTRIDSGESTTADLTVFNNMQRVQTVKVRFEASGKSQSYTRDISGTGQRSFSHSFTLKEDSSVKAIVMTEGDTCGSRTLSTQSRNVDVRGTRDRDEDGDAELTVRVRDEDGDDLEDARVEVSNGDDEVEYTDDDGEARFTLEPDDYEVEVSKSGYRTETKDIDLDSGDERTLTFHLEEGQRRTTIEAINHPSTVCRGSDLSVRVLVSNGHDRDRSFELRGDGLGSQTRNSFRVPEGESRVRTLVFPNVQRESPGSTERFRVTLQNGDFTSRTRTIQVVECDGTGAPGTATGISLDVSPSKVKSGEPVKVSGYVDGTRGRKEVDISVNGRTVARVSSAPDGYYQAFITPSGSGSKTVTASADSARASRTIEVVPTAGIDFVEAPDRVFQGESFQVCGNGVRSQVTPKVFLIEDGQVVDSRNAQGQVCFDVSAMETGEHEYRVAAVAGNQRAVASKKVTVLETREEATNFPDQIASVESGSGLVKVTLYNDQDSITRYDLSLSGIPADWVSQSEKQAVLEPGERREVFFYITPEEEGDYTADLEVSKQGTVIHRQDVRISSGGTTKPGKSLLGRVLARLGL